MFVVGNRYSFLLKVDGPVRSIEATVERYEEKTGLVQFAADNGDLTIISLNSGSFIAAHYRKP